MKRKTRRRIAFVSAAALAVATFPGYWGAAIAGRIARSYLDLDEPGSSRCTVGWISPFRVSVRDVSVGAAPGAPSLARLEARFTPWGLLRGRVRHVAAVGFSADFSNELAGAESLLGDTSVHAGLSLAWRDGKGYSGSLDGRAFGGPLKGSLGSDAALSNLTASLVFEPSLKGVELPPFAATFSAALAPAAETSLVATAHAGFAGSSWAVDATAAVGTNGAFAADAALPAASLARGDALVAPLLAWSGATGLVSHSGSRYHPSKAYPERVAFGSETSWP